MNRFRLPCIAVLLMMLAGCEALPLTNPYSKAAETTWLAEDLVDTLQTVQIAKHPNCYYEADGIAASLYGSDHPSVGKVVGFNFLLAIAHVGVSAWLDYEVDKHLQMDMATPGLDSVGPWYVGRIAFHTVSLGGTGYAVLNNFSHSITPFKSGCHQ